MATNPIWTEAVPASPSGARERFCRDIRAFIRSPRDPEARGALAASFDAVEMLLVDAWEKLGLDADGFAVLAAADAISSQPELLAAFARTFDAADPVTLVVCAPGADLEPALLAAIEAAGLDREGSADVLLFTAQADEGLLASAAIARLGRAGAPDPVSFGVDQLPVLRLLVGLLLTAQGRERTRDDGGPITFGAGTYYTDPCRFRTYAPGERIVVGRYCSIAEGVTIMCGGGHRFDTPSSYPFDPRLLGIDWLAEYEADPSSNRSYQTTKQTLIGNDVWIGIGATIGGGVTVGDGAVVATGAVVFQDVPPYAVVAGNPARVVRYRFSKEIVERLLRIAWWDWPEDVLRKNVDWFYRPINEFVDRFDPDPEGRTA